MSKSLKKSKDKVVSKVLESEKNDEIIFETLERASTFAKKIATSATENYQKVVAPETRVQLLSLIKRLFVPCIFVIYFNHETVAWMALLAWGIVNLKIRYALAVIAVYNFFMSCYAVNYQIIFTPIWD